VGGSLTALFFFHVSEWMQARVKAYNHRETIESVNEPEHFDYRGLQVQVQYN
jgi:hypothetical protein